MLYAILFGVGAAALVIALTLGHIAVGRPIFWDTWVKRTSGRMHSGGLTLAAVIATGMWGVSAALQAWPVFAGAWLSRKLSEIVLDLLARAGLLPASPMTRPQPRVIEHADGRRALVDARTGQGYQVLPAAPKREDPLTRWLNEKV